MQVIKNLSELQIDINTVLTVGTFDGVHLGHQAIFDRLKESAAKNNYRSVIVTFFPHPRTVVSDNFDIKLLTTFEEKVLVLSQIGIDFLVIVNFNKEFAGMSSEEFIRDFLMSRIGLSEFVIGHDHKFGKGRDGDENTLRSLAEKYDFTVTPVEPVEIEGQTVSSTRIRKLLDDGDLQSANKFLGRYYCFEGIIVSGATRGRILGFPTANISIENRNKLIPKTGVYAVECVLDEKTVYGVMNIGYRPTFEVNGGLVIEVHLFEFSKDVYGKKILVKLVKRLRDEKKFDSKEELIYQIERDKRKSIQILGNLIN